MDQEWTQKWSTLNSPAPEREWDSLPIKKREWTTPSLFYDLHSLSLSLGPLFSLFLSLRPEIGPLSPLSMKIPEIPSRAGDLLVGHFMVHLPVRIDTWSTTAQAGNGVVAV